MGNVNLYYRAFKSYRAHTEADKFCVRSRKNIKQATSSGDRLEATRNFCIINEDWVEKIEWGLPFIEKAIDEERQFIKNDGEVINIEKIKRVSKESVAHLARHSEYITREPKEDSDLVPDKIYMVKRDSDFTVYENRFLYMLLCYLRDFIGLRIKKIREAGSAYNGKFYYKRDFQINGGRLFFEGKFEENASKNPFSDEHGDYSLIERIEAAQHIVAALLNRPLIAIVSKTPMIKPPITKTNVLKMDLKFKNAVELYEYLAAYKGDGFRIERRTKVFTDFSGELADEIAEIVNLTSFLTYEYGTELNASLKKEYERELEEERLRLLSETERRAETLKKKFEAGKASPEEYILALEDTLKGYKKENENLKNTRSAYVLLSVKYDELKKETERLNEHIANLNNVIAQKDAAISELDLKYRTDIAKAEERRQKDLAAANAEYEKQRLELIAVYDLKIADYENKLSDAEKRRIDELNDLKTASDETLNALKSRFDALSCDHDLLIASFTAYRRLKGETDEKDYTEKADFEKLEKQFSAYFDFFSEQWKAAKKRVRKDFLWEKAKILRNKI